MSAIHVLITFKKSLRVKKDSVGKEEDREYDKVDDEEDEEWKKMERTEGPEINGDGCWGKGHQVSRR